MKSEPDIWKRKKSEKIADCRVFSVRRDVSERESDGAEATFFVVENPDWVNVVALTEKRQVVLIEQFRHGSEEIVLEIPGGMIDTGESSEAAARRELLEETGFSSNEFIFLGKSRPNPAIQNNWIFHYLALDCKETREAAFDEHESIFTKLVALSEIENLIRNEKFTHSLAVTAFYYLMLKDRMIFY
ncbi:MAG: NUDIX hydrolase [Acidobacteriota bacterium]|nr:NUDIX hydrolase [Acidobacteriota bacterium]